MPALSLAYERKTSPWIILCMKALEKQPGLSGCLEGQGCALAASSRFPPGEAKSMVDLRRVAKGNGCPNMSRLFPGGQRVPAGIPGTRPQCRARGSKVNAGECPGAVPGCRGARGVSSAQGRQ